MVHDVRISIVLAALAHIYTIFLYSHGASTNTTLFVQCQIASIYMYLHDVYMLHASMYNNNNSYHTCALYKYNIYIMHIIIIIMIDSMNMSHWIHSHMVHVLQNIYNNNIPEYKTTTDTRKKKLRRMKIDAYMYIDKLFGKLEKEVCLIIFMKRICLR